MSDGARLCRRRRIIGQPSSAAACEQRVRVAGGLYNRECLLFRFLVSKTMA